MELGMVAALVVVMVAAVVGILLSQHYTIQEQERSIRGLEASIEAQSEALEWAEHRCDLIPALVEDRTNLLLEVADLQRQLRRRPHGQSSSLSN